MAKRPRELSNLRILVAASAVTVTVVAWGVLVFAAIDFGRTARAGTNNGWLYLVLSTLGAVACMFAAIVMAAHLQSLMRIAQRSSTRPLAQPLASLPPLPEPDEEQPWETSSSAAPIPPSLLQPLPHEPTTTTYPSGGGRDPQPPRATQAGKRAAR